MNRALFAGLATFDIIQLVSAVPQPNEKLRALGFSTAGGGPALNAAVAFSAISRIGSPATQAPCDLLTRVPSDKLGDLVRQDLKERRVNLLSARSGPNDKTTAATILVTESTGDRAVVSAGDGSGSIPVGEPGRRVMDYIDRLVENWGTYGLFLSDGYQSDLSLVGAMRMKELGTLTVFDGGSVKANTEEILPYIDVAIVSDRFESDLGGRDVFDYLSSFGVSAAAVTRGGNPITYWIDGRTGELEVPSQPRVIDTLAAGDFFHGAFANAMCGVALSHDTFVDALEFATGVAGVSVSHFGTREWLDDLGRSLDRLRRS